MYLLFSLVLGICQQNRLRIIVRPCKYVLCGYFARPYGTCIYVSTGRARARMYVCACRAPVFANVHQCRESVVVRKMQIDFTVFVNFVTLVHLQSESL